MNNNYAEEFENPLPNISLRATTSADGQRITVIFPSEFIDAVVAFAADNYGRHRVVLDPIYNGQTVVGFVDNKVQYGKVEFNPASIGLPRLMPGSQSQWWARQRETDLLVGQLFTRLCQPQPVALVPEPKAIEVTKEVVIEKPRDMTIEEAINFINGWAASNRGELIVEDKYPIRRSAEKAWQLTPPRNARESD